VTLLVTVALLAIVALVASIVPARRASSRPPLCESSRAHCAKVLTIF
jgi:hypothetical protein